jgi:hypothetical protein
MNFLKIKLLVIALIVFAASSAFADFNGTVSINTSSLSSPTGYLYLQYSNGGTPGYSTATVSSFFTDGVLGAQDTVDIVNGSAVSGTLPGSVLFANLNPVNDYNQAITFGSTITFLLSLSGPLPGGTAGSTSTFSIGLFADGPGTIPLINTTGPYAGTAFTVDQYSNGTAATTVMASGVEVTPTPIPAAAWLLGSGLFGLVGLRKRVKR